MSLALSLKPTIVDRLIPRSIATDIALVVSGAALTALAAQWVIPMYPVPFTGQTFAVLLVATALGTWRGASAMLLYVLAGAAGLPIFNNGNSGIFVEKAGTMSLTPTLGYLVGFIAAAAVAGKLAELQWDKRVLGVAASFVAGNLVIYAFGVPTLAVVLGLDLATALQLGFVPFLIGDALKLVAAAALLPLAWRGTNRISKN